MDVATSKFLDLLQRLASIVILRRRHGQSDQNLVGMQAWILGTQVLGLERLNRLDGLGRQQVDIVIDTCQVLQCIEQHRRRASQQGRGAAGDHGAVVQLHSRGRLAGFFRALARRCYHGPIFYLDAGLSHDDGGALGLLGAQARTRLFHLGLEVAADNFLLGSGAAHGVVSNAEAGHVHAHVRRRLVRGGAGELFQKRAQQRECFHIAVVVHGGFAVGGQVEVVNNIGIVQVHRGCLIGQVHGVFQGEIPDREGFKFGVAGIIAALVLVVDLRERGGQLSGARARRGDHDKVAGGFRKLIAPKALFGHDKVRIGGVAGDNAVARHLEAEALDLFDEGLRLGVAFLQLGHDDVFYQESAAAEYVHQAQQVIFIKDAQVRAHLLAGDILRVDADEDLNVLFDALQHRDFIVRGEAGQYAGGVHIVKKLAAHL